jgi:hypothetical protein
VWFVANPAFNRAIKAPRTRAEALADAQWISKVRYYVSIVEIIVADVST